MEKSSMRLPKPRDIFTDEEKKEFLIGNLETKENTGYNIEELKKIFIDSLLILSSDNELPLNDNKTSDLRILLNVFQSADFNRTPAFKDLRIELLFKGELAQDVLLTMYHIWRPLIIKIFGEGTLILNL